MLYTIELYCGEGRGWERAWAFPKRYTEAEANAVVEAVGIMYNARLGCERALEAFNFDRENV